LRAVAERMKGTDEGALHLAIDELQRLAEDYLDLERMMQAPLRMNYPPEITLGPRVNPAELAESVAIQERHRLGLGDQPIIHLRSTLEWDVGLRLFYWDLPSSIAGMYACTSDLGCCILINRKHPAERRRHSMLHEYGHLLVDRFKPGIDYLTMPGRKPANERFAEAFAHCFLMPATSVRQRFNDIVNTMGDFQVADLRRLSHFYFASVEAMALRLEQLGLISKGSWQFLKESKFAPKQAAELLGLRPQPLNDQPFPERYQFLAVHAYERGEIGDSDLAHFFRCDVVTAREIVAKTLLSREVVESTGEERDVELDFQKSLLTEA
jgi:Zn-dependent peptidase ImmA (M78 family)